MAETVEVVVEENLEEEGMIRMEDIMWGVIGTLGLGFVVVAGVVGGRRVLGSWGKGSSGSGEGTSASGERYEPGMWIRQGYD